VIKYIDQSAILKLKKYIMSTNKLNKQLGFTIVETIIVLAIAGLIMAIVFIAIPEAQVIRRDNIRKNYIARLIQSEEEYLKNNNKFPACDDGAVHACTPEDITAAERFITLYMPEGNDPSTGQPYSDTSSNSGYDSNGAFVRTDTDTVYYFYNAGYVSHSITPALGQIFVATGHYCLGDGPSAPGDGPLSGSDTDLSRIVVLIGLERGGYYCLDNNGT
jgi:prepilin-type N-terminal cleavage/methylation domain-containing protein